MPKKAAADVGDVEMDAEFEDVEVMNVTPPPMSMYTDIMKAQKAIVSKDPNKRVYTKKVGVIELFRYADKWDIIMITVSLLAGIGGGIMFPIFIVTMGHIIDDFGGGGGTGNMISSQIPMTNMTPSFLSAIQREAMKLFKDSVWDSCKKMLYFGAITFVLRLLQTSCGTITATRQSDVIRKKYFSAAISQEVGWFDSHQTGALTATLTDIQRIQDGLGERLAMLLNGFASFVGGLVVAFTKGWKMALVILATSPVLVLVVSGIAFTMIKLFAKIQDYYARAGQVAEEILSCVRTVVSFGIQGSALKRYNDNLNLSHKVGNLRGWAMGGAFGSLNFVLFATFGLAFWYGGTLVVEGEMTSGAVFIVFTGIMMGTMSLSMIAPHISKLADACGCAYEVYGTIDRKSLIDPREDSKLDDEANNYVIKGDIEFRNVCFRYPTRPESLVLRNFDLQIPFGKTTALVGPSGCGKSTVVGLLERFYDCEDGFGEVLIDGRNIKSIGIKNLRRQIGIVTQEPVLFATTIAQNIAWGATDDYGLTDDVKNTKSEKADASSVPMEDIIEAAKMANADGFISKLTDGYDTLVGQRGAQLSGGQKQRIAIARALIRKPKILIFDEATSALDTKSEADVQEAIDKVASSCTCIIIAHRLSTVQNADQIAAFKGGRVVELGTHDELMNIEGGLYRSLVERQHLSKRRKGEKKVKMPKVKREKKEDGTVTTTTSSANVSASSSPELSRSPSPSSSPSLKKGKGSFSTSVLQLTDEELEEEKRQVNKAAFKTMMRAFGVLKPNTHLVIFSSLGAIVNGAIMPIFALFMAEIMEVLMYDPANPGSVTESEHNAELRFWALLFLALGVVSVISNLLQFTCMNFAAERMTHYLRYESFKGMLRQEMGWFDDKRNMTGVLTTRLATDSSLVYELTANQISTILQVIASFVSGIAVGFTGSWKVALVCLACVPVLLGTSFFHMRMMTTYAQRIKKAYEEGGRVASEALENVRTVVSLGRERTFLEEFDLQLRRPVRLGNRTNTIHALGSAIQSLFQFWIAALAFWYGSELMTDPAEGVTFADIMKAQMGMMFGAQGIGQIASFFPDYGKTVTAAYHIFQLFDRKPSVPYPHIVDFRPVRAINYFKVQDIDTQLASRPESEQPNDGHPKRILEEVHGEVEFTDVKFSYPTRPDIPVLKGLTFSAKPKQTVALVGESGCGKSTTVSLLERLYLPTGGTIKLDGVPIDELEVGWLRSQIGLVSQEPILFASSIYENIRYGKPDATKEEIENAAKMANAHNFIQSFPQGYDTPVGEKGVTLSGGQKQRIAIARALVRNPKVLLLDEATSALDAESEKVVQDALDRAREGRTTIVIAHRLSTIKNADLIVVIDDGTVYEEGTHKSLIDKPDSLYAMLANAQKDVQ